MRKVIEELLASDITGYRMWKDAGIDQATTSRLRTGDRKLDGISLSLAERYYNYAMKLKAEDEI